ncbi:unnamed protein product [Rotaria magnacalcarata]|uniref:B30.2/SPRY domain-containing protein n=1 Tax=Rotaria magnacalcarata TaxID=392030 RepID=A0A814QYA2_9BILA|nr:unnamed protein product [Rotaria magnacalcarata]CAF1623619.1 unnamed protein product [Rotaria magnacalcarata]CAF2051087.1 unnamed protein product [Rotaria magnacalcarata]CAF2076238.1 unnamed protein product [Rotaria magnacalcarata]CAF2157778.1 unnamed protein product [Rotaria magnacalcarata]
MPSLTREKQSCSPLYKVSQNTFVDKAEQHSSVAHSMKHREKLANQMKNVYLYHNQIRQIVIYDTKDFTNNFLMKRVDDWERQSILKIQQTASDVRQELTQVVTKHTTEMSEIFAEISQQLNKARVQNNYIENDIKCWLEKLEQFIKDFQTPKTINIISDERAHAFIPKIKLSLASVDSFHQANGDIQVDYSGYTITHGLSNGDATIHGKTEYYSGIHKFRFQIEKLGTPKWVFFGIVSKNASSQANLHRTRTVYGWAGHHQVWLNGVHHHQHLGYVCEFDVSHIIELFVDCDKKVIRLTNETTSSTHEIDVPPIKCPLPWTLYLGLYGSGDQVRLLFA